MQPRTNPRHRQQDAASALTRTHLTHPPVSPQLHRLAEQQEESAGGDKRQAADGKARGSGRGSGEGEAEGGGGGGEGEGGEEGSGEEEGDANIAALLPFDVVATAYRRKKLIGALEEGDK